MEGLNNSEQRTYVAFTQLVDRWGNINATMVELGELLGYSRETLRQAIRGLEGKGLVETTRTKRNYGKLYKNRYKLVGLASTADYGITINSHNDIVTNTTERINTSYLFGAKAPRERMKEINVVNRWQDDENIAGVGSFDSGIGIARSDTKINKNDPKTRFIRPRDEWTAGDVASEFASRVYARVRGIPGLVNTQKVRGALSKNRKNHGITAAIELEIMDMFFGDTRFLQGAKNSPQFIPGRFLRMFTTHLDKALENLGLPALDQDGDIPVASDSTPYVYASDGKAFDNSMPGRKKRDRYELTIKKG
jgi:DNA-binding Lrp family transcriptional regulator